MRLPVITGFGGINPSGRLSFHQGYKRLVIDAMSTAEQDTAYRSLAGLMGVDDPDDLQSRQYMRENTLIRHIDVFDPAKVFIQSSVRLRPVREGKPLKFVLNKRQLPAHIPSGWKLDSIDDSTVGVSVTGELDALIPNIRVSRVSSAGQLPKGFNPGELYQSRNHPRGLQLAVYGASDALRSTGISIERFKQVVPPDQIAVYSSSAMGQLDSEGYGALFQNPMCGKRPSSKNVPLGLSEMPGDFVNAYVFGSVGGTGGMIGACATYLYNVRHAVEEIKSGRKRLVIVGNSEAPIVPEVIEGYRTMGALAEDEQLMALDNSHVADHRRACRPFSSNTGFTVAESAVYTVIMDDELALELGARILGSVGGIFVNADGYKKSIPGPGIGNYLTVGKAMGIARAIMGEKSLRERTQMFAHGTGTQQNRTTESHVLNEMAKAFGVDNWPVCAIKAYVGHSLGPAGGDQLAAILGTWQYGWMPGITTVDHVADDVHDSNLNFALSHLQIDPHDMEGAFINSKGFGGNNATGFFLSPGYTTHMLTQRWGEKKMNAWRHRNEAVVSTAIDYDERADGGDFPPIYQLGEGVVESEDLEISPGEIRIPGFGHSVDLNLDNPYADMTVKDE
jgi:acetoacetyl-[acyl-carrier protein] synthase